MELDFRGDTTDGWEGDGAEVDEPWTLRTKVWLQMVETIKKLSLADDGRPPAWICG